MKVVGVGLEVVELDGNGGDNEGESSEGGMTAVGGGRRAERSNLVFLAG